MNTLISRIALKTPRLLVLFALLITTACSVTPKKSLIVQANDLGIAKSIDDASIDLLNKSHVSSLSIIVVAPRFKELAEFARNNPQYDYGVRLTVSSAGHIGDMGRFRPVLPPSEVPSIVDEQGYLYFDTSFLKHYNLAEVEKELQAQIDAAKEAGLKVSHLSVRGGDLYRNIELVDLLAKLSIANKTPIAVPNLENFDQFSCFEQTKELIPQLKERLASLHFSTLAKWDIQNFNISPEYKKDYFSNLIKTLPLGVSLIEIRPSFNDNSLLAAYKRSDGSTDLQHRFADYEAFSGNEIGQLLSAPDLQLIGWQDFR
jgi:predicted glycoside hydrolase/deacetylase ChbG (UPF0249 family)